MLLLLRDWLLTSRQKIGCIFVVRVRARPRLHFRLHRTLRKYV